MMQKCESSLNIRAKAVVDLGGREGRALSWPKISSFLCSFQIKLAK